ncbi:NAD(P)(+)--arginine ADP-ribosyltransferase 2-like [Misgurnus anguillicaudatus]|uniref:NAD(P)(+)--arginine ADP-ribosyltransferase 2-like n=1 Tax=Misgurnus anguillicaudatus TaxID=75329 RepID=UPI003CCFCB0C
MAKNSVDDQYNGCAADMNNLVEKEDYLNKEIKANISGFGDAWSKSENKTKGKKLEPLKTKKHLIAIYVYTGIKGDLYKEFNQDVRTGIEKYKTNKFSWYTLYFWLTRAIQTLKQTQKRCISTYRRTNVTFVVKNKEIRFGSFASSSLKRDVGHTFGNESCFEIKTCHGANVTDYSWHPDQKEVLIPPYETFEVTNIRKGKKDDWCKTVFVLNSTGIKSNLNCKLCKKIK